MKRADSDGPNVRAGSCATWRPRCYWTLSGQVLRDLQEAEGVVHEDHAVVPPDRVDPALTGGPAVGAEEMRDELDAHADPVDDEEVLEVPQEEDLRGVGDRRGHRAGLVGRIPDQLVAEPIEQANPQG